MHPKRRESEPNWANNKEPKSCQISMYEECGPFFGGHLWIPLWVHVVCFQNERNKKGIKRSGYSSLYVMTEGFFICQGSNVVSQIGHGPREIGIDQQKCRKEAYQTITKAPKNNGPLPHRLLPIGLPNCCVEEFFCCGILKCISSNQRSRICLRQ